MYACRGNLPCILFRGDFLFNMAIDSGVFSMSISSNCCFFLSSITYKNCARILFLDLCSMVKRYSEGC